MDTRGLSYRTCWAVLGKLDYTLEVKTFFFFDGLVSLDA